jgi:hypothetical protein
VSEQRPRSFAELREWQQSLDPAGLHGFVRRTSRTYQRLEAGEKLVFETRAEEQAREFAEWEDERKNKLSDDEVRQIRKLREAGMSFRSIAAKFNRGQERIQRIVNGVSYKGVK